MKKKSGLFVLILLLAVGFAAVSTSLIINGTGVFGTNVSDFEIIFTKSVIDGVDVSASTISEDGKSLTFTTSELAIKDEVSILNFVVANNSTQYDASVQMECIAEGENYNEYYKIEHTIPEIIKASSKEKGSVTVTLLKTSVNEIEETFTCTIKANAVERTEASEANRSEISVTAKDESNTDLNARAYEITGEDEEKLLDSLVKTGYIENVTDVDALIEVESDEFDTIADTTFDVSSIASAGDTVVILHFDEEKQEWEYIGTETVDENGLVSGDFTSYSPVAFVVVKEDGTYKNKYKEYSKGEVLTISNENFNVISQTDDTVTMLAEFNLGTNYKQSETANYVTFSNGIGWENTPGPKEIDIQVWSTNPKTYINEYVTYLQTELGSTSISGNLITMTELKALGCIINDDYSNGTGLTCANSQYFNWLVNGQDWWTRSAYVSGNNRIWYVFAVGKLNDNVYYGSMGVRPVITISKAALS